MAVAGLEADIRERRGSVGGRRKGLERRRRGKKGGEVVWGADVAIPCRRTDDIIQIANDVVAAQSQKATANV